MSRLQKRPRRRLMKFYVRYIVQILLGYIKRFIRDFQIKQQKKKLSHTREASDDAVKKANDDYDDFRAVYDKYRASAKPADVRPDPRALCEDCGKPKKGN